MSLAPDPLLRDLVLANRILANEGVVDGFGHVSVRHPEESGRFIVSRSLSPEFVEVGDLQLIDSGGGRVGGDGRPSYAEVAIHAALYRARADIGAVCHGHSPAVVPFGVTGVPLRPIYHMASVIGNDIPVWDIAERFGPTDLLVRTAEQGDALARALGARRVALMRGHGWVVAAADVRSAVFTAIYLERNASLLAEALRLGPVRYLSEAEVERASATLSKPLSSGRAWEHWTRRLPS